MCCTKFNSIWRRHRQGTWKKNELGQQWITEAKIFQCQKEQQQQTVAMNRTCELPFLKNVTYLVVESLLETPVLGSDRVDHIQPYASSINVLRSEIECISETWVPIILSKFCEPAEQLLLDNQSSFERILCSLLNLNTVILNAFSHFWYNS